MMNQSLSEDFDDGEGQIFPDPDAAQHASRRQPVLHFPTWRTKALLIESLIIVVGFASVLVYNWLFDAAISPLLGMILGVVNGTLVAWCLTHADQRNKGSRDD